MKSFKVNIKTGLSTLAGVLMLCATGCSADSDLRLEQQEDFYTYLESTHSPRLIPEEEVATSSEANPEYYTLMDDRALFRYIKNVYREGRSSQAELRAGDVAKINYSIYAFDFANISDDDMPVFSNDSALEARFIETGLNTEFWDFNPLSLGVGGDDRLSAISKVLDGCRVGDSVELYTISDAAYGGMQVGLVPADSPAAFFFTVIEKE